MCHRKFFLFVFLARKQEVVCGFQFLCHPVSVYKQADRPYACHPFVTIASELDEYLLVILARESRLPFQFVQCRSTTQFHCCAVCFVSLAFWKITE